MRHATLIPVLILSSALFAGSTVEGAAPPPQGRTYFVNVMGLGDEPYDMSVACLAFDATQACVPDDEVCLNWQRSEGGVQTVQVSGFTVDGELNDDGLVITMDGQGRVEGRGRKSSITIAARAQALGVQLNYVIAGRQASRGRCRRMVEAYNEAQ